jgi:hypothetical protein
MDVSFPSVVPHSLRFSVHCIGVEMFLIVVLTVVQATWTTTNEATNKTNPCVSWILCVRDWREMRTNCASGERGRGIVLKSDERRQRQSEREREDRERERERELEREGEKYLQTGH